MTSMKPTIATHLLVDVSAHGLGHLAQVAPVLNALGARLPKLRISLRSGLSSSQLRARIVTTFTHLPGASDFGYVMRDATRVDLAATALAYQRQHADWEQLLARETAFLAALGPDLVLSDVAYLPLAGAQRARIPSIAMCSLNWAELFAHFFASEPWAAPIHHEMLAAYNSTEFFLRLTPAMPMADLRRLRNIGPVAAIGRSHRRELRGKLGCARDERLLLVAFGGFDKRLSLADWPLAGKLRWLVPQTWHSACPAAHALEGLGLAFTDLICSVDAVLTKPGYGTFTEAACNGTPVLYLRRDNWPEQEPLIAWLEKNARCRAIDESELSASSIAGALDDLFRQTAPPIPQAGGADAAAAILADCLS
ncbi:hypothetical protein [Accumulibacter sp.]|uniref:hypothetical protein n=2 Tax=Accumulibacter sp. TaxID=2053492 RepID=UPI002878D856|nr:hypothetical protein [Accumulibacter sp.]MDS4054008.1 hypothetical protein [Accumulibacter sp.]HMW79388.1 hypothetical protein [Accumulibacter sp.]HND38508.1 hypothetical protein [Accumulibacter sp.]HNI51751.1 hypothetical protein [Accumulibacter sp.]